MRPKYIAPIIKRCSGVTSKYLRSSSVLRRKSESRRGREATRISSKMILNRVISRKTMMMDPTSQSHGESAVTMRPPSRKPNGIRLNRLII
jgi:hypothetical protein